MLQDFIGISFTIDNKSTSAAVQFEAGTIAEAVEPTRSATNELLFQESLDFSIQLVTPLEHDAISTRLSLQFEQADDGINILVVDEMKWRLEVKDETYYFNWPAKGEPTHRFLLPVTTPITDEGIVIVGTVEMPVVPPHH